MDPTIVTALIGALATLVSALIGVRTATQKEKRNRELSDEIVDLRSSGYRVPMLTPEQYGIDVVAPAEYAKAGNSFAVSGTYKALPESQHIWTSAFRVDEDGNISDYWPQGEARATNGKWYGHIHNISGEPGETKEFLVLVVGRDGDALFRHYGRVGAMTGNWPSIHILTSDVVVCKKWSFKI